MFVSNACRLHTWHHDVIKSFLFVQCHWIVKAVMAFYFSWTAQNMLKRRGKVRNGSVFKKILCMPSSFIPSNGCLETVLLPFPIKKLECLYLWVYASTSATYIIITLSISMQTGMLDFSGTAQKVQMVQHYEHVFFQTVISNWWHYELFITKVHGLLLSCYSFCTVIR